MKFIYLLGFITFACMGYSQNGNVPTISYMDCDTLSARYGPPAPCSIEGDGVLSDIWVIKLGTYTNFINPKPMVLVLPFGGQYNYYYSLLFSSESDAKKMVPYLVAQGYCDAYVVIFPLVEMKMTKQTITHPTVKFASYGSNN